MADMRIRPLPGDVIGQIAAGEVVERPSAAIKELVENSIDAGATAITVDIQDGGLTLLRVVDNGSGIAPSEIRMAFSRHATSKITTSGDLYGVRTMGFRGEALASIAAVARVECASRVKAADMGVSVRNEGGVITDIREAACPEGTAFTVRDLFYNAPVRRKFMKKPSAETSAVSDLMLRFILSHPQISFRYATDGKTVYFSAGDGRLDSAVMSVYGLSALEQLRRVTGSAGGLALDGYVGVGDAARGNRSHQTFVLNGRIIRSALLTAALEDACRQRVTAGRFPLCVAHITMPYENADVNVHPNKWEVRFLNERAIREAVTGLVLDALQDMSPIDAAAPLFPPAPAPSAATIAVHDSVSDKSADKQTDVHQKQTDVNFPQNGANSGQTSVHNKYTIVQSAKNDTNSDQTVVHNNHTNVYSQNNTDLRAANNGLPSGGALAAPARRGVLMARDSANPAYSLSRRAEALRRRAALSAQIQSGNAPDAAQSIPKPADERDPQANHVEQTASRQVEGMLGDHPIHMLGVLFDTYIVLECDDNMLLCDQHALHERLLFDRMMCAYDNGEAAQMLLSPELIRLTHREYAAFLDNRETLLRAGFDMDDYGGLTVQLRSVPLILGSAQGGNCLKDALDELADGGQISQKSKVERIMQMACKHAVKGGEKVNTDALYALVRTMMTSHVTPTCPHGRPLIVAVSHRDLDKRFRRIQG